ncbi:DUF6573 family protein [Cytobacillus oceanisediminis]|uniref:DUF6573 family protein n=1 Tax=Cytobacillus oceanisediminis TaxID=665099 RepID=UPI001FB55E90|nr:DUF6573 family protein [Cytobacillus oceanisediminis]UOE58030.1 hypothetical protein IRB79_27590 [Cytobacillus oceanisediminis]
MENIFGDYISIYTRAEALADGELVDVTSTAREAGFKFPVAVTRSVWDGIVKPDKTAENRGESESGRLWDILFMLLVAIKRGQGDTSMVKYKVIATHKGRHKTHELVAVIGPGDTPEPVLTIMLPGED